jgi:hypothetical protein
LAIAAVSVLYFPKGLTNREQSPPEALKQQSGFHFSGRGETKPSIARDRFAAAQVT